LPVVAMSSGAFVVEVLDVGGMFAVSR